MSPDDPAKPGAEASDEEDRPTGGEAVEGGSTLHHAGAARQDPAHPSWANLVTKIVGFIEREYAREVRPPVTLDELQSEALDRVFRGLGQIELRDREQFWGWVRRLTHNALIDLLRRRGALKRGGDRVQSLDEERGPEPCDDRAGSVSGIAYFVDMQQVMLDCLAKIGEPTSDVLRLRLLEHRSHDEIRDALGFRRAVTVRARFTRGLEQLRDCLSHRGYGIDG